MTGLEEVAVGAERSRRVAWAKYKALESEHQRLAAAHAAVLARLDSTQEQGLLTGEDATVPIPTHPRPRIVFPCPCCRQLCFGNVLSSRVNQFDLFIDPWADYGHGDQVRLAREVPWAVPSRRFLGDIIPAGPADGRPDPRTEVRRIIAAARGRRRKGA